jgi:uncharacterized SAM-binding protein YcdF (DUF218 family)
MNKSMFKFTSKLAVIILFILGLIELGIALWTVLDTRYKCLAYNLADVGYIVSFYFDKKIKLLFLLNRIYGYYDIYPCVYLLHRLLH